MPAPSKNADKIRLFAMDVDGVLTDGAIVYDSQGAESKAFCVQDGLGLAALRRHGFLLAIITGRNSAVVERRANELGVHHVIQGRHDKAAALGELADRLGVPLSQCAYAGDDLPDVKAIRLAGLGFSVANGCPQAKAAADIVTQNCGGHGAVRQMCEILLQRAGVYEDFLAEFLS